jgi:hypothetical protein
MLEEFHFIKNKLLIIIIISNVNVGKLTGLADTFNLKARFSHQFVSFSLLLLIEYETNILNRI